MTKPNNNCNERTDERQTYSMDINCISLKFKRKLEKLSGQRIIFNGKNTLFNLITIKTELMKDITLPRNVSNSDLQ